MTQKTKVNLLPSITWRFTESNSADIDLKELRFEKENTKIINEVPKDFHSQFSDLKFGVSEEILSINEETRNYENFYLFENNEGIQQNFIFNEENMSLSDLHGIDVKEGADATLFLDYRSEGDIEAYRNTVIKIKAEKNSRIKLILIQRLSENSKSFLSIVSDLEEDASVDLVHIEVGSKESYTNYKVNIKGDRSHSDIKTAYYVNKKRYLDLAYEMTHRGKETTSDMVIHGVLKDYAKKRFAGTLDFKKGCTLSAGNEEEFVTLLDPTVKNWAVPILLAREHDIVGNHAASAGRVDKDMLFYITSRGFDELAAKKIVVESKIKPVLDLIDNEEVAEEILTGILESIN